MTNDVRQCKDKTKKDYLAILRIQLKSRPNKYIKGQQFCSLLVGALGTELGMMKGWNDALLESKKYKEINDNYDAIEIIVNWAQESMKKVKLQES